MTKTKRFPQTRKCLAFEALHWARNGCGIGCGGKVVERERWRWDARDREWKYQGTYLACENFKCRENPHGTCKFYISHPYDSTRRVAPASTPAVFSTVSDVAAE